MNLSLSGELRAESSLRILSYVLRFTFSSVEGLLKLRVFPLDNNSKALYQLGTFLDDGSYGKVSRGKKLRTNEDVAIKIIKGDYLEAGPMEFKALKEIKRIKADKNNLIKCIDKFNYRNRAFIVFEMLDQNLHHFLSKRKFSPLGISEIKVISQQLLVALKALKSIGLVHTDIKLDNIMLVDHKSQPFRVKLIDFGLALKLEDLETGSIFQTMPYRAPEVRLGLPLNEGVDMWGLGHTLAMLLKGSSLHCSSFEEILQERNGQVELFVNLLEKMLFIDPYRRITPEEALQHPFFTENSDDNNQIVKAVSDIANKRSATELMQQMSGSAVSTPPRWALLPIVLQSPRIPLSPPLSRHWLYF
uniref:Protein kinase domain-containing protein n=1 Tax=Oryzias latipes TaxID=8090 RepID=A0A3P9JA82_ORYLA